MQQSSVYCLVSVVTVPVQGMRAGRLQYNPVLCDAEHGAVDPHARQLTSLLLLSRTSPHPALVLCACSPRSPPQSVGDHTRRKTYTVAEACLTRRSYKEAPFDSPGWPDESVSRCAQWFAARRCRGPSTAACGAAEAATGAVAAASTASLASGVPASA